jgi:hypothetical protein
MVAGGLHISAAKCSADVRAETRVILSTMTFSSSTAIEGVCDDYNGQDLFHTTLEYMLNTLCATALVPS